MKKNIKGTITADESGELACTCGNTSFSDGFYPCNVRGATVEPTAKDWPAPFRYKCERCGAQWFKPSAFKHTPGPWKRNGTGTLLHPVTGAALSLIKIETVLGSIEIHDETNEPEYNARLIEAAPALLTRLQDLCDSLTNDVMSQLDHEDEKRNAGHEENCVLCQALALIEELKG